MPEKWTGDLVGKMHVNHVTLAELGKELGITKAYVGMILNGSAASGATWTTRSA